MSILLLWWAVHDVTLADVERHVSSARPWPLFWGTVLATVTFPLRTARWRYLLRLEGEVLPFAPLWHATTIGFMANNVLPARAGELARGFAASRLTGVRFSTAVASIAVERVMDGLATVALLMAGASAGGFALDTSLLGFTLGGLAAGAGALFALVLVAGLVVVRWPAPFLRIARALSARLLPESLRVRVDDLVEGLLSGLDALSSPLRLLVVSAYSLVIWGSYAGSYWLFFRAFSLDLSGGAACLLQALIALGVAIPSSPGFFGPFEAVTRATLALYGVEAGVAVPYAVTAHVATFLPVTLLGLWSLSRAHLHLADLRSAAPGAS